MTKLRVLDLFSGIGGFSLGLERTGGFETVAFCEIEPFPRRVLAKHWPEVPIYEDVRTLTGDVLARGGIAVDVITGGFPCQDLSVAGKQAGMGEGTRSGLWSEIVRLIGDLSPRYVIVENVANLLSGPSDRRGGWFGRVLGDLAECGYDAEWENIPAAAVGAPHRRERVWIVAYPGLRNGAGSEANPERADANGTGPHRAQKHVNGKIERGNQQERLTGPLGQILANTAQVQRDGGDYHAGNRLECGPLSKLGNDGRSVFVADAASIGQSRPGQPFLTSNCAPEGQGQTDHAFAVGLGSIWGVEPNVGRVANGVPNRVDRLAGLGNAVVPQIPELIGHAILEAEAAA